MFIATRYTAQIAAKKRVALYRGLSVCSEVRGKETKAKEIETVFRISANFLLTKQNFSGIHDCAVHRGRQDVKIHYAMQINLTVERLRN
jgi:DNA invertase Pin-like site-specific DNA recombinase